MPVKSCLKRMSLGGRNGLLLWAGCFSYKVINEIFICWLARAFFVAGKSVTDTLDHC